MDGLLNALGFGAFISKVSGFEQYITMPVRGYYQSNRQHSTFEAQSSIVYWQLCDMSILLVIQGEKNEFCPKV